MNYYNTLRVKVYQAFDWFLGDKDRQPYEMDQRQSRILQHYAREVDSHHMDTTSAFERCIGDIKGRNYHPVGIQRG